MTSYIKKCCRLWYIGSEVLPCLSQLCLTEMLSIEGWHPVRRDGEDTILCGYGDEG